jgi:putative aminopeptidase FrvX
MELLHQLCALHAPSGSEEPIRDFILKYVEGNRSRWKKQPRVIWGEEFQDCLMLVFGNPKTAAFAHMDSIGYTVRYNNQLVPIGGPHNEEGYKLSGRDSIGEVKAVLNIDEETDKIFAASERDIERGTTLVFECNFRETEEYVQSCYMDNRLGVWTMLKLAETLENGVIVFSCWEEHGGGSVPYLAKYLYETYQIRQALIADITWVTEGVQHGKGVAISLRDRNIPRKSYLDRIIEIAKASGVPYQLEVEGSGSSDGRELQTSPYPFDWCFVGAPESNVHTPDEKVHRADIDAMLKMYRVLMEKL